MTTNHTLAERGERGEVMQEDKDLAAWFTRRMSGGNVYAEVASNLLAKYRIAARNAALEEAARVAAGHFDLRHADRARFAGAAIAQAIRTLSTQPHTNKGD